MEKTTVKDYAESEKLAMQQERSLPPLSESSLSSLYAMAHELYRNGKYEDAKGFFRFLTVANTFDRRFWMGLGACYQMLKQYEAAIECYSVAAIQNPDDPYVHWYAANCFFSMNQKTQAAKTIESAIIVAKKAPEYRPLISKLEVLFDQWSAELNGGTHE